MNLAKFIMNPFVLQETCPITSNGFYTYIDETNIINMSHEFFPNKFLEIVKNEKIYTLELPEESFESYGVVVDLPYFITSYLLGNKMIIVIWESSSGLYQLVNINHFGDIIGVDYPKVFLRSFDGILKCLNLLSQDLQDYVNLAQLERGITSIFYHVAYEYRKLR